MNLAKCRVSNAALRGLMLVAAGMTAVAGSPAAAKLGPASPEAIASAAADCWEAVGPGTVDEAVLQSKGWSAGSVQSKGKVVETPLRFYGKKGSSVLLMLMDQPKAFGCTILSAVAQSRDLETSSRMLLARLQAMDPAIKGTRRGAATFYVSGPKVVAFQPGDEAKEPAVRIAVVYTSSEKK